MLRNIADLRAVLWCVIATALLIVQWNLEEFNPWLFIAACYFAVSITTITHNHNHLRIWKNKWLNRVQDFWLTGLYGFPVFAWIPTHNKNHHKFNNREGDYTITYRVSERNNLLTLLSYPTISSYFQQKPIRDYLGTLWRKRRSEFWWCMAQYAFIITYVAGALILDWKKGLLYVVIPQQVGLFSVLVFNYLQHVHADEEDEWNHSRNIINPVFNFFMFNNGYHTIHHNKPGLHWSLAGEEHAKIADNVDPSLNERSFWWLLLRTYILAPVIPSLRKPNMRLERMAREQEDAAPSNMEPAAAE